MYITHLTPLHSMNPTVSFCRQKDTLQPWTALTLNQPGSEMSVNYQGPFGFDLAFTRCKLTSPGILRVCIERCGFGNLPRTVRQH